MKELHLTNGKTALVDDEDYKYLNQWKWYAVKSRNTFYAVRNSSRKTPPKRLIQMHRLLLGLTETKIQGDHIDRNGLNNQRANIRPSTHGQNQNNSISKCGVSKYKGVCMDKYHKKWQAQIAKNGVYKYLGVFETEIEAAFAYNNAAKKLHGEFANLNII